MESNFLLVGCPLVTNGILDVSQMIYHSLLDGPQIMTTSSLIDARLCLIVSVIVARW
jgi:hypothetical protein